jgi:hypothetical protein
LWNEFFIFYGYLEYNTAIWYIFWPFGNFVAVWYIFPRFGMFNQEKSGNPEPCFSLFAGHYGSSPED